MDRLMDIHSCQYLGAGQRVEIKVPPPWRGRNAAPYAYHGLAVLGRLAVSSKAPEVSLQLRVRFYTESLALAFPAIDHDNLMCTVWQFFAVVF